MRIGIIAGNRSLPGLLAQEIKKLKKVEICAVCFKGETSSSMREFSDKIFWIEPANLGSLRQIIHQEKIDEWIMAGQISPWRLFKRKKWDKEITALVDGLKDVRPHSIFEAIINKLQEDGANFIDSTKYLSSHMAKAGVLNGLKLDANLLSDIAFGTKVISGFVELDVGQTIVVKSRSVVALEALEGTDNTIIRGAKLAGQGCTIFKFSKLNQDMRFDVPVVGMNTLNLAKKIKAKALVLEQDRVIILDKTSFLEQSLKWGIPVIGKQREV